MKQLIYAALGLLALSIGAGSCRRGAETAAPMPFVTVGDDGQFYIGDSVYNYVGANFWYGAILASEGRGGDRSRLASELDMLQELGIDNLRILVGGDGDEWVPSHIMPVLQTAPGVYNDTILDGLDYLMAELERRGMHAVLYLNNSWEWSGGYGTYLEWVTGQPTPNPSVDGYQAYTSYVTQFVTNDSCKALAADHVRNIVGRDNRYTGKPYSESPALMAWQIANEPRAFADDSVTKAAFYDWIMATADLIHSLDPNHLVSTGSEGLYGCQVDMDLWTRIHNSDKIDYAILHLWPYNWSWISDSTVADSVGVAIANGREYIDMHRQATGKPLVMEEFGYPRDGMAIAPGSPTTGRDQFYEAIYSYAVDSAKLNGTNFWGWGGLAKPAHASWQAWDDYTGDPAQEAQGLNSVFAADSSTLAIIKKYAKKYSNK